MNMNGENLCVIQLAQKPTIEWSNKRELSFSLLSPPSLSSPLSPIPLYHISRMYLLCVSHICISLRPPSSHPSSLWFGEWFNYTEACDFYLVELSGLPFGVWCMYTHHMSHAHKYTRVHTRALLTLTPNERLKQHDSACSRVTYANF